MYDFSGLPKKTKSCGIEKEPPTPPRLSGFLGKRARENKIQKTKEKRLSFQVFYY
jgi:hypothetical protein